MVKRIYLVRHGETAATSGRRFEGSGPISGLGTPLSEKGAIQAEMAADALAGEDVFGVYASPLLRTVQTATPISQATGVAIELEPDLAEGSFGAWEGMTFDEIEHRYPLEVKRWFADPLGYAPPGGESVRQLAARVIPCIERIAGKSYGEEGTAVVVTHGGPIRAVLSSCLCGNLEMFGSIPVDPGSISTLRCVGPGAAGIEVESMNVTSFSERGRAARFRG
ncbi:MAG TPA: histidine phosphatase family protein [Bacillota bacterium]|nr:histidine phosphatase family protein [Bacillota bacterium]HOL51330.1 histidine phosphatase family protein [Bacillota bacterium]HOO30933.1 histidine phosphatase family protein [Bacillota bacterium]HPQ02818.1 histidine phosphatase family protein [Bacillota bacterium]HQD80186.1 histidine phosphatase family protein [Bacillota bacterium]